MLWGFVLPGAYGVPSFGAVHSAGFRPQRG